MNKSKETSKQICVYVPETIWEWVDNLARQNYRSRNAQIVKFLEEIKQREEANAN